MSLQFFTRMGIRFSAVLTITVLCSVAVLALVAMRQLRLFGEYAVEQNRSHILSQAEGYLEDKTYERAQHLQAIFHQAEAHVDLLARRIEQVMDDRSFYGARNYNPDEVLVRNPANSIFTNDETSIASCVYWGADELSEEVSIEVNALSHLDSMLRDMHEIIPGAAASWFITDSGLARYYPNIHQVDLMPPASEYDYRDDLCYLVATPERNPEREVVWHEVYLDSMGQGLIITVAAPAYGKDDRFLASAGVDISLSGILEGTVLGGVETGEEGFSFVVDDAGRLIAFPLQKLELFSLDVGNLDDFSPGTLLKYALQDSSNPDVRRASGSMSTVGTGVMEIMLHDEEYVLAYEPMGALGWTLGHVVPMREVMASVEKTRQGISTSRDVIAFRYLWVTLAVLACSLFATLVFFNVSFFHPLGRIMTTVRRVSTGDFRARAGMTRKDEMGTLASAVDEMAGQLEYQQGELLAARELYRDLFEGAMSGLFRSNAEGRLLSVNNSLAELFGYEDAEQLLAEVEGLSTKLYAEPGIRERLIADVQEQGVVEGRELQMRRRDGTLFWLAINMRAVKATEDKDAYFEGAVVDITDRRRAEEYRAMLSRELIRIQETERRWLATELHDNLAQELSALKIAFEMLLDDQPEASESTRKRAEQCARMLRGSIGSVRGMAQGLGPFGLEQIGLAGMLGEYCDRYSESTGVAVEFNVAGLGNISLPEESTVHVFRIVQEALNNVRKHSGASTVKVRLVVSHPHLIVRVEDDGKGFAKDRQQGEPISGLRMGLMSIRERARLLNGIASIDSVEGRGTRILVEIPLDDHADAFSAEYRDSE